MWVEFVVGSRPCSERVFYGYYGFPHLSKANISRFQFDLDVRLLIGLGSIPGLAVMWVEFVVGSRPCSERVFYGYYRNGFPHFVKNQHFQIPIDLDVRLLIGSALVRS